MADVELRTYCFIDSMQQQFTAFMATVMRGYLPVAGQAALYIETAPSMIINKITDVALKATEVRPGTQIVERAYGMLEVHADDQASVRQAGVAILDYLKLKVEDRTVPKIVSSEIIRKVSDFQCQLINRMRHGNMLLGGQTLYILEVLPAGYAVLAANEAEKAAHINILEVLSFGAFGRVYIGGEEAEVVVGGKAAEESLKAIQGK
ncbi:hypothetical protein ES703_23183 [subsurface metagenome]